MESNVCKNDTCRLGCICESIGGTIKRDHCNEVVCMFNCVCHLPNEKAEREKIAQCWFPLILVSYFCI